MRSIILATILAAGIGMVGTATASAAPAAGFSGTALDQFAGTDQVQWRRRWRHRRYYGPRCRLRCNGYGRCWRVCW